MNNKKNCDLHTHSYYSDGEFSPTQLVNKAKKLGIKCLALADHNSVNGVEEAIRKGKKRGITVIPALEVMTKEAELLGYFIDYKNPSLKKELKKFSHHLNEKVKARLAAFQKLGINISYKKFKKIFPYPKDNYEFGNINNYFLGKIKMSQKDYFSLLDKAKPLTKKHKDKTPSIIKGIKLIKKYKGVPVFAHPWISVYNKKLEFNEKNIKELVKAGLKGIEINNHEGYNFGRTKEFVKKIKKLAKKYNLVITSGSDFHGPVLTCFKGYHKLGKSNCDEKVVEELKLLKNEIKAIVFDIGGVLYDESINDYLNKTLTKKLKVNLNDLRNARKKYLKKAQTGELGELTYPKLIAKELNIDEKKFINLFKIGRKRSIKLKKDVEKTLLKLKKNYTIATLTNITTINHKLRLQKNAYKHFKIKLISCNEGLCKPDPEFYKLLIKKLKLSPEQIVFIDDDAKLLIPAKKLGIKTILFKNNNQLIKDLRKFGVEVD